MVLDAPTACDEEVLMRYARIGLTAAFLFSSTAISPAALGAKVREFLVERRLACGAGDKQQLHGVRHDGVPWRF